MVLGAVAPRGIAENELKLSLSMGEENGRNSKGRGYAGSVLAESELSLALSMGKKIIEIPKENP